LLTIAEGKTTGLQRLYCPASQSTPELQDYVAAE
jgi:hypothetical protein